MRCCCIDCVLFSTTHTVSHCCLIFVLLLFLHQLIVATEQEELPRLAELYERARINQVPDIRMVEAHEIADIEPYCKVDDSPSQ